MSTEIYKITYFFLKSNILFFTVIFIILIVNQEFFLYSQKKIGITMIPIFYYI